MTKTEKVKGINDNKRKERQAERRSKSETLFNEQLKRKEDNVTQIGASESKPKSFKLPTKLTDLLKGEDADE